MTLHKPQDERHREILDAARGRFVVDGYAGARLNDIAADAGLSKGGVYFHFKSKREIFDALIADDLAQAVDQLEAMKAIEGRVPDKLAFFAREVLRQSAVDPVRPKFQIVMAEMALAHDDVRARLKELHEVSIEALKRVLESGVAQGELRADLDLDTSARLLMGLIDGMRVAVSAELHETAVFERLIVGGVRVLIEGFLPTGQRLAA